MTFDRQAKDDFDRAIWKAFWRRIISLLTGAKNELLPFDEFRRRLPMKGQHYLGIRQVPIDNIVGSEGRFTDFDRAFLPIQSTTKDRWINIDLAQYNQVALPAVDLYKMGEVYFVRDGNHRVSVARQRGQEFIDAYVIEIDIPVPLTPDTGVDDLALKEEYARFIERTDLFRLYPEARLETGIPGQYNKLLEHIDVHRWFLGEQTGQEVPYSQAVVSWYESIYLPVVTTVREIDLGKSLPGATEIDLYLWVMDYQWYLKQGLSHIKKDDKEGNKEIDDSEAERHLLLGNPQMPVRKLINALNRSNTLETILFKQERALFNEKTHIALLRPGTEINSTLPGSYDRIEEHISAHRWYLGEKLGSSVSYEEAVISWYDNLYLPIVKIIHDQDILSNFPGRSETDLYLWIIEHQWYLNQEYGEQVSFEQAAEVFAEDFVTREKKKGRADCSN